MYCIGLNFFYIVNILYLYIHKQTQGKQFFIKLGQFLTDKTIVDFILKLITSKLVKATRLSNEVTLQLSIYLQKCLLYWLT